MSRTTALRREVDPMKGIRREFPSLRKYTHFISHSLGALPRAAEKHLRNFTGLWRARSIEAWHDWLPLVTECGDRIGKILGAPRGTVVMHQNVSTLMGIVASAFDYQKRNRVVLTEMNFPSICYVWREQARYGAEAHFVPTRDGITIETEDFIRAIDDRTMAVVIELVLYRSGAIQDAKRIIQAAHAKGALAIIDGYQASGTVPVDVLDLDCDFYMGGSVKWLCGGPGAAYLYVKKDLISKFEPALTGWFSHREPFSFAPGRIEYRDDIMRYMGGTPSVPSLYSCRAGQEIVGKLGVRNIRRKSMRQTARIVELAQESGLRINTPLDPARRGGMVCLDFPGAERVHDELLRKKFMVDHRPQCGIRLSPHFYTNDDEIDEVMRQIRKLRDKRGSK